MNKYILFFGNTSGIGKNIISNYKNDNIILCNRNIELSKKLFPNNINIKIDLSDSSCLDSFINEISEILTKNNGYIDIIFCNSGIKSKKKKLSFFANEYPETYIVNFLSYQYIINNLILNNLLIQNKSIIYFMTSIMHVNATENIITNNPNYYYHNSKLLLFYLSKYYNENNYYSILINPGYVNTNIFGNNESYISKKIKNILSISTLQCCTLINELLNNKQFYTENFNKIKDDNNLIYITLYKYNYFIEFLSKIFNIFLFLYDITISFNLKKSIMEKNSSYSQNITNIKYITNYKLFSNL